MCGIFGLIKSDNNLLSHKKANRLAKKLYLLSESRGKESAGISLVTNEEIFVYKEPRPANKLVKSPVFSGLLKENWQAFVGHARLVTNGDLSSNENNQPVSRDGQVAVHNGIVVNVEELWEKNKKLKRKYEVDTEVILALFKESFSKTKSFGKALKSTFSKIDGAASIGVLFASQDVLLLATNTGSLYYNFNEKDFVFASEYYILKRLLGEKNDIKQLKPQEWALIKISDLTFKKAAFHSEIKITRAAKSRKINDKSLYDGKKARSFEPKPVSLKIEKFFEQAKEKINSLKRCRKCVLPETFPFISFDEKGVCNYCNHYRKNVVLGKQKLLEAIKPYRRKDGKPEVLVTFSGGRDSSYGLHYVKKELGLNPVAYTYDWGMITDLGRRNQSRMTGRLGVEHVLVSADIPTKRMYIRKNVTAWLKKPNLGTVPLFMAGDKQYFYFANKISKDLNLKLTILCINPFEKTDFKFGFCGVRPDPKVFYRLKTLKKLQMAAFYGASYLKNPAYINSSLFDTMFAYASYYFIKHNYLSLYDYIKWDEEEISKTLKRGYNWETATDTKSTWRIGDGTASFYNYIYYILAGFSENDTFRSNQIREGLLNRSEALKMVNKENDPRYDSIEWYCDTIGIDFNETIKRIHQAKKLYEGAR